MKSKRIKELQQLSDDELKQLALQRHMTGRKKINYNCIASTVGAMATSRKTISI